MFFLSISETLNRLKSTMQCQSRGIKLPANAIEDGDLDMGLFFLACTRKWIDYFRGRSEAHAKLADAMLKAEQEERICWANNGGDSSSGLGYLTWDMLSEFLSRLGYKKLHFYKADGYVPYSQVEAACRIGGRNRNKFIFVHRTE
jgi:hypothetical protein